ncbi:MAG: hypothetical protein IKU02_07735 [Bacteroidaceae bacterium]|nr:hypothetical protein [Bacteroidaceae bacterium]
MKKIALFALTITMLIQVKAQESTNPSAENDHVFYKTIPQNLNIKDKIFIQNKSPYYILQVAVAIPDENGELVPLGLSSHISPNETWELASFENNYLKKLRGKSIAIKAKAAKIAVGENNNTSVWTPFGGIGVAHKELDPTILNSIKPSDITYDFNANLFEENHDLYIVLFSKGNKGVMDF